MSSKDEPHWWEKEVRVPPGYLDWCPLHNYYYDAPGGQVCLRCRDAREKGTSRRAPMNPMGNSVLDRFMPEG